MPWKLNSSQHALVYLHVLKVERELQREMPNMSKVLSWKRKSEKLVERGHRYLDQIIASESPDLETEVSFKLEKISERYVKKFGASSCVYRATMERRDDLKEIKLKNIMTELSSLFDSAISQVSFAIVLCYLSSFGVSTFSRYVSFLQEIPSFLMFPPAVSTF